MGKRNRVAAPWLRIVRDGEPTPYLGTVQDTMKSPACVFELVRQRAAKELVEVFYVIVLDSQSHVLACSEVTRGILNSSLVHPREVYRLAIAFGAAGIIVAHNHPSGDPNPSADDRAITRQLADAGRVLDIPLYDAVVVGNGRYLSFAEAGLL